MRRWRGARWTGTAGVAVLLVLAAVPVLAQEFPTRPVEVIVGFAPGGGTDLIARAVANVAPKHLGQPLAVVNKPGAAGTLAGQYVASAKPDGYTLLVAGGSESTSVAHFRSLPYHPLDDFEPIIRFVRMRILVNVRAESPWRSVQEFLADAKRSPGKYSYGSSGVGSHYHATMVVLEKRTGISLKHVPFKGGAETLAALAGGHVDVALSSPDEAWALIEGGRIRTLASTSDSRSPLLPNVPTLRELGYDVWMENMKGFVAPKGTPRAVVQKLHDSLRKVFDDPVFKESMEKLKLEPSYLNGEEFKRAMKAMSDQIGESVKK